MSAEDDNGISRKQERFVRLFEPRDQFLSPSTYEGTFSCLDTPDPYQTYKAY